MSFTNTNRESQTQPQTQTQPQPQPQTQTHQDEYTHLIDRIDAIERKLDLILLKLDNDVIDNCDKMGTHIDFVNGVYDTVKVPLNYISNKIHKIINPFGAHKALPLINEAPVPKLHVANGSF